MLGQIISAATLIVVVSIIAPFVFAIWILKLILGHRSRKKQRDNYYSEEEELSRKMKDLKKRISNIETINKSKKKEW